MGGEQGTVGRWPMPGGLSLPPQKLSLQYSVQPHLKVDERSPQASKESQFPHRLSSFAAHGLGRRHFNTFEDDDDDEAFPRNISCGSNEFLTVADPYLDVEHARERTSSDDFEGRKCCAPTAYIARKHEDGHVPISERTRHLLLSLRLRKAYALYCFLCFALSAIVCCSTFFRVVKRTQEGRVVARHRWLLWEEVLEVLIGLAVITETFTTFWLAGRKSFVRDCWCLFDAAVVVLTLLDWCLLVLRRSIFEEHMAKVDFPLFALRFVLQPCRLMASVSMLRRVRRMQQSTVDIAFDMVPKVEFQIQVSEDSRILTPELQAEVTAHLPAWCRKRRAWDLLYSPGIHGTSLQTFYSCQEGPNVILVRDVKGHVFGGFAPEAWSVSTNGGRCTQDCFIFTSRLLQKDDEMVRSSNWNSMTFYHVAEHSHSVSLRADNNMLALGHGLVICDDFRSGSSAPCPAMDSPSLTEDGLDFVIADFECWGIQKRSEK